MMHVPINLKKKVQFIYSSSPLDTGGNSVYEKDSRLKNRCADNIKKGLPKIGFRCGMISFKLGTSREIV